MSKNSSVTKPDQAKKNKEFAVVTYSFFLLFFLLVGYFVYFMVFKSETAINHPYNKRQESFEKYIVRGSILSADGKVLAETKKDSEGKDQRIYPYNNLFAHAIGYSKNGRAGVESIANFQLLRSNSFIAERIMNEVKGEQNLGDTVYTTYLYDLQKAANDALGSYKGAVIAIEPSTGKILAMVSKPDFDPNTIVTDWDRWLKLDPDESVLINRATQGSYAPGSVFKIFTTTEYLEEHPDDYNDFSYHCNGSTTVKGNSIQCYDKIKHGDENLKKAFAQSCNSAFATIGLTLNPTDFTKLCTKLLFNKKLPTEYPSAKSKFNLDDHSSNASIMEASIGQEKTTVSPLHMALISSAIANNGILMETQVIDHTTNAKEVGVKSYDPEEYGRLFSNAQASILQEFMRETVLTGTAKALKSNQYEAYGKTGSAQVSDSSDATHSWFTGYATDSSNKTIALAVIVEKSGSGSKFAVPIAKKVFDSYFR